MNHENKTAFFDSIAQNWDGWKDLDTLATKLDTGLASFGIGENEHVLDVGCGTGNLTLALLRRLSLKGRVTAVDISPEMIRTARRKISDPRVTWHVVDALELPAGDNTLDRVICYSVWPHFDDYPAVLNEFRRVLRPKGTLHIWHLSSREAINDIHQSAGEAVKHDVLAPVAVTREILEACDFAPMLAEEDDRHYLITARPR